MTAEVLIENGQAPRALMAREAPGERGLALNKLAFEPENWEQAIKVADVLFKSRLLPAGIDTPQKAVAMIVLGRELGLTTMQAFRAIYVMDPKDGGGVRPTLSAQLMIALVLQSGVCDFFELVDSSDTSCTYETQRKGARRPTKLTWTIEMARSAELINRPTWKRYPHSMLRNRCGAELCRAVYPDIVLGLYDPDEAEDRIIDVTPLPEQPTSSFPGATTAERLVNKLRPQTHAEPPQAVVSGTTQPPAPEPPVPEAVTPPTALPEEAPALASDAEPLTPDYQEAFKGELAKLQGQLVELLGKERAQACWSGANGVKSLRGIRTRAHCEERVLQAKALLELAHADIEIAHVKADLTKHLGGSEANERMRSAGIPEKSVMGLPPKAAHEALDAIIRLLEEAAPTPPSELRVEEHDDLPWGGAES